MFGEGSFEREGEGEDEKWNGVVSVIEGEKGRKYMVFDEVKMVDEVKGGEFGMMWGVGYCGGKRRGKKGRWVYGIGVEVEGVEMEELRDVLEEMKEDFVGECR